MGETQETLEPQNKSGQGGVLHKVPKLQIRICQTEANGLVGLPKKRKRTELANIGHIMDDETFITNLLISLPQAEYEGAILAIKERMRRCSYDLPEIEQILEDKYQSMKYVKGWDEEEDDYVLFAIATNKKGCWKAL